VNDDLQIPGALGQAVPRQFYKARSRDLQLPCSRNLIYQPDLQSRGVAQRRNWLKKRASCEDVCNVPENMKGEVINGKLITTPRPAGRQIEAAAPLSMIAGSRSKMRQGCIQWHYEVKSKSGRAAFGRRIFLWCQRGLLLSQTCAN
jgi:hypothetical protein